MSLQTWMDEFYPTPTRKFPTELEAVEHSLRKWKGLTKENLKKHHVIKSGSLLRDDAYERFFIDSTTCALCQQHTENSEDFADCDKCILKKVNVSEFDGQHYRCDATLLEKGVGIYQEFVSYGNPQPMIELLEKAKAYLCQQNSVQNKA